MCLIFLLLSGFCFSRGLYCSAFPRSVLQITSLTNILTFPIKHNTSTSRSFRFSSQQGCLQVCGSSCASAWQIGWDSIPGRWYTGKERLHCGFGDVWSWQNNLGSAGGIICTQMVFHLYELCNVFPVGALDWISFHSHCTHKVFLLCGYACDPSVYFHPGNSFHKIHIHMDGHLCESEGGVLVRYGLGKSCYTHCRCNFALLHGLPCAVGEQSESESASRRGDRTPPYQNHCAFSGERHMHLP